MPRQTLAWDVIYHQFGVTQNGREHVIKIVCNAPRERAQGVRFMALTHLGLEVMPCGDVETGDKHGGQALPSSRGHADLQPEPALILAYALHEVTLRGSRSLQTGVAIPFPGGMLMRRQERAHVAAMQVIRLDIPKERGHDGVDKLDDAVPLEYAYALQGASDEVTVVGFALLQRLL